MVMKIEYAKPKGVIVLNILNIMNPEIEKKIAVQALLMQELFR